MGQLEKYGLYVLCLVIFLILGVSIWGHDDAKKPGQSSPAVAMHVPGGNANVGSGSGNQANRRAGELRNVSNRSNGSQPTSDIGSLLDVETLLDVTDPPRKQPTRKPVDAGGARNQGTPQDANGKRADLIGGGNTNGSGPSPQPVAPPQPKPQPVATTRSYTIQKGDVLGVIAQRELGSVRFLGEIEKLNPGLDARSLIPGKKILLPARGGAAAADAGVTGEERLRRAGAYREYTISKGDTLERIARVELGSAGRVGELKDLNPGLRPRSMRIGAKIKLPIK